MRHLHLCRLTLLLGCTLSLASTAAPTTEAPGAPDANATPVNSLGLGANLGARPGDRNSDARTIDMLVDMQQPSAGIQFNERSGRSTTRESPARTAQPAPAATPLGLPSPTQRPQLEAPLTPPSGLFGSGATPAALARTDGGVDRSSSSESVPARAAGRPGAELPPELKRWLHWPRRFIIYVSENRAFVFSITAVLLLLGWTGSLMFSRRRG